MNNPIWIDDKGKIVEPEYCRDFLSRHPMRCINDHFYTVDGPLPDESKLKRTIYEEISPWLHDKVAQTVEQVLKTLKLAAYADPLPLQCDRIHVANTTTTFMWCMSRWWRNRFSGRSGARISPLWVQSRKRSCRSAGAKSGNPR